MAPVTRFQAAKALILASQNDNERVQKSVRQKPKAKRAVTQRDKGLSGLEKKQLQREILDKMLKGPSIYLRGLCKDRVSHGLTPDQLLEAVERVCRERKYGTLKLERRISQVRRALKAAAESSGSTGIVMSSQEITDCLTRKVNESLRASHEASAENRPAECQAQIDTYFRARTDTTDVSNTPSQADVVEERNNETLTDLHVETSPEVFSNDRERIAKLSFSPKHGRDMDIESALLDILITLGRDSLEDLSYDDYVRMIQIIKNEYLATIKLEIYWNPHQTE